MATPFDPNAIFPSFYDAPDPSTLQWPWSQPPAPVVDPAVAPPVAAAPEVAAPVPPPPLEVAPPVPLPPAEPAPIAIAAPIDTLPSMVTHAPPAPDALTGAAGQPPAGDLGGAPYAPTATPEQAYQQAVAASKGDPLAIQDEAQRQRALNELALRDPAGFAELQLRHTAAREKEIGAKRLEIANRDFEQQQANFKSREIALAHARAKGDELERDAQRIADTKIDPTIGGIAPVLMGVIGGLIQGRTGSATNTGIDALKGIIQQRLEVQKANLANQREGLGMRRSALASEFARVGDDYQAAETVRLAALKHADDLLATEQQNYDPRGTTALRITALRTGIAAEQQKVRQDREQKAFENSIKLQDAARQQQIADETARNNRAQTGVEYAKLKSAEEDRKLQRDIRAQDKTDAAAAKAQEQHDKQILERSFGGEVVTNPDGTQSLGPLRMKNGDVFIAKGPEGHVAALRKQHDAATTLVRTLDEIKRVGPEWLSDTANTDKFQRLHQLMGDARLQAIAAKNLGVPTGHDIELAEAFLGTTDATRRKDSIAGLAQARTSLVRDHNVELQHAGLDKPWDPPDTSTLPSKAPTFKPTTVERASDATPGAITRFATERLSYTDPQEKLQEGMRAAENTPAGPTGLAVEDSARVVDAIKSASKATPAERAALVDKLSAWAQSPRESVANGVLGLVRGESPALYGEVLAKLPKDQREKLPDFSSLPLPGANLPAPTPARRPPPVPVWNGSDWVLPEGK